MSIYLYLNFHENDQAAVETEWSYIFFSLVISRLSKTKFNTFEVLIVHINHMHKGKHQIRPILIPPFYFSVKWAPGWPKKTKALKLQNIWMCNLPSSFQWPHAVASPRPLPLLPHTWSPWSTSWGGPCWALPACMGSWTWSQEEACFCPTASALWGS